MVKMISNDQTNERKNIIEATEPNPPGRRGANLSTNKKAGTAVIGCGRLVKIAHNTAMQKK